MALTLEETAKLESFGRMIGAHLDQIRAGAEPKSNVLFMIWWPDHPDQDFALTSGEFEEAAEVLRKRIESKNSVKGST